MRVDNKYIKESINWLKQNYLFANNNPINVDIGTEIYLDISENYEYEVQLSEEDFKELIEELKSSEIFDEHIRTKTRIIYNLGNKVDFYEFEEINQFDFENDDLSFNIIEPDAFILLSYIKRLGSTRKYFDSIVIPSFAEVKLKNKVLANDEIKNKLLSYLFELSNSLGLCLGIVEIDFHENPEYDYMYNDPKSSNKVFNQLKNHNLLMVDFIECVDSKNSDLQYLGFFKILECCGANLIQQDLYNKLRNKVTNCTGDIEELQCIVHTVNIAKSNYKNTQELINKLLSNDRIKFKTLKESLPETLKNLEFKDIINKLCAFRNKVCHNKATYQDKENIENYINNDNIENLNLFMKNLAYNAIHWYSDTCDNYKLKI